MKAMKKSIRLKEMKNFIFKMNLRLSPLIILFVILVLSVSTYMAKCIFSFLGLYVFLTILFLSIGMYRFEKKETMDSLRIFERNFDVKYKKITFGNEDETLFKMVIPISTAISLWNFNKKYCFIDELKWNALYAMIFSEKLITEDAYLVSFNLKEQDVNKTILEKRYFCKDDLYFMF